MLSRQNDTNFSLVGEMRVGEMSLNHSNTHVLINFRLSFTSFQVRQDVSSTVTITLLRRAESNYLFSGST